MVSYEVSIGFVLVTVLLCAGSLNLSDIVVAQRHVWFVFPLLPMAVIFFVSGLAETNRAPFDLPEGESELVAGYFVEYSAMAFALFYLGEYANMILVSAMTTILFLGGWLPPFGIEPFSGVAAHIWHGLWLLAKTFFVMFCILWMRATFPRFRYDQLMRLGWKVFLPFSMFWLVLTAGVLTAFGWVPVRRTGERRRLWCHRGSTDEFRGAPVAQPPARRADFRPRLDLALHVSAPGDGQLPLRKRPAQSALPRRACTAPIPERRRTLHRLQIVRSDLSGIGDHDRGGAARRWQPAHDALRH